MMVFINQNNQPSWPVIKYMARRGQKRLEKFEESCNILRLQLLYVDEVNEYGHELTKLSNQIDIASGAKHEKI